MINEAITTSKKINVQNWEPWLSCDFKYVANIREQIYSRSLYENLEKDWLLSDW